MELRLEKQALIINFSLHFRTTSLNIDRIMKSFYVFGIFLSVSILLSNCKTPVYTPDNWPEKSLQFGHGGGVTGEVINYYLLENGQMFKQRSMKGIKEELASIDKKKAVTYFERADALGIVDLKIKEPGNIYYFIEYGGNKIVWGNIEHAMEPKVDAFFVELSNLTDGKFPVK